MSDKTEIDPKEFLKTLLSYEGDMSVGDRTLLAEKSAREAAGLIKPEKEPKEKSND